MSSRQLLAFKHEPTVEIRLDNIDVLVKHDRVHLQAGELAYFSWDEWRAFAERVEQSIQWVETNTPEDVTSTSFGGDDD